MQEQVTAHAYVVYAYALITSEQSNVKKTCYWGKSAPPSTNLFEIFHPKIQTFKQAELIASINNLFTEELKMVDQLKQDSCIAHAVRRDPSSQSTPKRKMMECTQPEEVLVEDTKIGNIT